MGSSSTSTPLFLPRTAVMQTAVTPEPLQPLPAQVDSQYPLNFGQPLAQNLAGFWLPVAGLKGGPQIVDLSQRRRNANFVNTVNWTSSLYGLAITVPSTGSAKIASGTFQSFIGGGSYTVSVGFIASAITTRQYFVADYDASAGNGTFGIFVDTTSHIKAFQTNTSGGTTVNLDCGFSVVAGQFYVATLTWNGTNLYLYVNGSLTASASLTSWPTIAIGSQVVSLAAAGGYTGFPSLSPFLFGVAYTVSLSPVQIQKFYQEAVSNWPNLLNRRGIGNSARTFVMDYVAPPVPPAIIAVNTPDIGSVSRGLPISSREVNLQSPLNATNALVKKVNVFWTPVSGLMSGIQAIDLSGNRNHASFALNNPSFTKIQWRNDGIIFNNTNNNVASGFGLPTNSLLGMGTTSSPDFTVFARMTPLIGTTTLFSHHSGTFGNQLQCTITPGSPPTLSFLFNSNYSQNLPALPTTDANYVLSKIGSNVTLYFNNAPAVSFALSANTITGDDSQSKTVAVVRGPTSGVQPSIIYAYAVFPFGLTATQVNQLYQESVSNYPSMLNRTRKSYFFTATPVPAQNTVVTPSTTLWSPTRKVPVFDRIDTQKPLNASHPLVQNALALWIPVPSTTGGTTLYDLSQNKINGSLQTGVSWSGATVGPALLTNSAAASSYISFPSMPAINSFTFFCCFQLIGSSSGTFPYLFSSRQTGVPGFQIANAVGSSTTFVPELVIWSGSAETTHFATSTVLSIGSPVVCLCVTWNAASSTGKIYINGLLQPSGTTASNYPVTAPVNLFQGFNGQKMSLKCTSCGILPYVLAPLQVTQLYQETISGFPNLLNRRQLVIGGLAPPAPILFPAQWKGQSPSRPAADPLSEVDLQSPINWNSPLFN